MKRWAFGSIAFFFTLVIGLVVGRLFLYEQHAREAVEIEEVLISTTGSKPQIDPEFKNVRLPEEFESGEYRSILPVFEGTAYLGKCELNLETKGPWLGLYKHQDSYSLEFAKVKRGPSETDDFGTYIPMHFRDSRNALFLIGQDTRLKPGPVSTLYLMPLGNERDYLSLLRVGFRREFTLDQRTYVIRVSSGTTDSGGPVSVLVLENEDKKEILYYRSQPFDGGNIGALEWVGDLDSDFKLDLLFSFYDQNGGGKRYILFVSSIAKRDFLVQPYAFFHSRSRGC